VRVPMARLLVTRNRRLPAPEQRWSEVEQLLDEAAKEKPDSVEVVIARAEMHSARKDIARAEEALRQARDARPEQAEPWIALIALAVQQEKFDAASALLDAAGEKLGDRVELRLARAGYWAERGGDQATRGIARLGENIGRYSPDEQQRLL